MTFGTSEIDVSMHVMNDKDSAFTNCTLANGEFNVGSRDGPIVVKFKTVFFVKFFLCDVLIFSCHAVGLKGIATGAPKKRSTD